MLLDKKLLEKELLLMDDEESVTEMEENSRGLKRLFLVLAGDKRETKKLTLEDYADIFNSVDYLLDSYSRRMDKLIDLSQLEKSKDVRRRAL